VYIFLKSPNTLQAKFIGTFAANITASSTKGAVIGTTSQGVFLKCEFEGEKISEDRFPLFSDFVGARRTSPGAISNFTPKSDRIIFFTTQPYPGPLTINISQINDSLKLIQSGIEFESRESTIFFPALDIAIQTSSGEIWDSPTPSTKPRSIHSREKLIKKVANQIIAQAGKKGQPDISDLVRLVIFREYNKNIELSPHTKAISDFIIQVRGNGSLPVLSTALSLLGQGEGLTPSGDDLVLGLVLTLNRWKNILIPDIDIDDFNENIIREAFKRTTTLSANLIECAVFRQADERLVNALDQIICEIPFNKDSLGASLKWGSSSGYYVMLGILCAVTWVDKSQYCG
jgi:hypothetical protein